MDSTEAMEALEFQKRFLIRAVSKEFDGPIYVGGEDLDAVRNSESPMVAVVAKESALIFFIPREQFLKESPEILDSDELFDLAVSGDLLNEDMTRK